MCLSIVCVFAVLSFFVKLVRWCVFVVVCGVVHIFKVCVHQFCVCFSGCVCFCGCVNVSYWYVSVCLIR